MSMKVPYKKLFLILAVFVAGCTAAPRPVAVTTHQELNLKNLCEKHDIYWKWDSVSRVVTLKNDGLTAKVLVGSDLVILEGQRINLSAPVRTVKSSIMVPSDFRRKVIDILKPRKVRKVTKRKGVRFRPELRQVILDAGHGGKDPGAIGRTGIYEKKVVLDITKKLKRELEKRGVKVTMTRSSDEYISLAKRTEIASRTKADLFVSIHANAHPVRSVHGMEVYSAKDLTYMDKDEKQRKRNHYLLFQKLSMKRDDADLKSIVADMLYTHKKAESDDLAEEVSRSVSRSVRARNLGLKHARFYVLRNTLIPAILVEVGYLSNPKEERLLKTSTYRTKLAKSLADSIADYINGR